MPPTRAEIAAGLGFSTASSAEDHLQALARKGAIDILPGTSRGLRMKSLPGIPLQGLLPLVGRVAAGHPILAVEHIEAHYRVHSALFSRAPTTCCATRPEHAGRRHPRRRSPRRPPYSRGAQRSIVWRACPGPAATK